MNDSDHVVAMETWYLGAQNDGLFIINRPPRPSNDHAIHDREDGPTLVLPLGGMPEKQARAIIDAHNSEVLASRLAKQAPALPQDVITLVIAAREMFDLGYDPDHAEANALDRALDAFSSRVPYENQPNEEAHSPVGGSVS